MPHEDEERLDRLFAAYRDTFPDLDASENFLPAIWERIDSEGGVGWILPLQAWATRLAAALISP